MIYLCKEINQYFILKMPPQIYASHISTSGQTPFALAMKHEPQCVYPDDPVRSYQEYYQTKQDRFQMNWTKRQIPEWFNAVV